MKLSKPASELLERYMLGVRRALSGDKRDDIAREIESSILDRLEERFPQAAEISEQDLKSVLEELGSPYKLAGEFRFPGHLAFSMPGASPWWTRWDSGEATGRTDGDYGVAPEAGDAATDADAADAAAPQGN